MHHLEDLSLGHASGFDGKYYSIISRWSNVSREVNLLENLQGATSKGVKADRLLVVQHPLGLFWGRSEIWRSGADPGRPEIDRACPQVRVRVVSK